ncbi:hypothetical protein ACFZAV_27425 [Streptomyces sp. NPDC008343]|uniref:hypothetical protein n=1 Tax=Streptomyces sp. NPDC008343 TaxID=3364828 RepID=UPI0036F0F372
MTLTALASRTRTRPRGDAEVLRAVRGGQGRLFEVIRRRHWAAAVAYALTCTPSSDLATDLASSAFAGLRDRVVSPVPLEQGRHSGCVRLQLLESVRLAAVTRALRSPHSFLPEFTRWIRGGSMWPMLDDGQLALAYEQLPPMAQCLLWHLLAEGDHEHDIAAISGLSGDDLTLGLQRADSMLRQVRIDLYCERLENADCLQYLQFVTGVPHASLDPAVADHLGNCPRCFALYEDLVDLDARASRHLPLRLLGWWPVHEYQSNKRHPRSPSFDSYGPSRRAAADPGPPGGGGARHRKPSAYRRFMAPSNRRRGVALAVAAGVLGSTALAVHWVAGTHTGPGLGPGPSQPGPSVPSAPPSSADGVVSADAFAYSQGAVPSAPPDDPRARVLTDGVELGYSGVQFGAALYNRLGVRVSGVTEDASRLEFYAGKGEGRLWATVDLTSPGAAGEPVEVRVRELTGRQNLRVVARCEGDNPCVTLHSFRLLGSETRASGPGRGAAT